MSSLRSPSVIWDFPFWCSSISRSFFHVTTFFVVARPLPSGIVECVLDTRSLNNFADKDGVLNLEIEGRDAWDLTTMTIVTRMEKGQFKPSKCISKALDLL
jgi:hypothetical protein